MEKLIIRIDPSSLAQANCLQNFKYVNMDGLTSLSRDHKMEYGSAVHKAIAEFYRGKSISESITAGIEYYANFLEFIPDTDWRSISHLQETLLAWFKEYGKFDMFTPTKNDKGEVGVELPFALPFMAFEKTEFLLTGVIDAIGLWNGTLECFKDIKSTASNQIDTFFRGYELNHQMMIYAWALREIGWTKHLPACVIDGVFISKSGRKLQRSSLIDYREDLVAECIEWVRVKCREINDAVERGVFQRNFTSCSTKFGMCSFAKVCGIQEGYRRGVIQSGYGVRVYDPSKFGQVEQ